MCRTNVPQMSKERGCEHVSIVRGWLLISICKHVMYLLTTAWLSKSRMYTALPADTNRIAERGMWNVCSEQRRTEDEPRWGHCTVKRRIEGPRRIHPCRNWNYDNRCSLPTWIVNHHSKRTAVPQGTQSILHASVRCECFSSSIPRFDPRQMDNIRWSLQTNLMLLPGRYMVQLKMHPCV